MSKNLVISVSDMGVLEALGLAIRKLKEIEKELQSPENTVLVIEIMRAAMELSGISIAPEDYEKIKQILVENLKKVK